ncbi:D-psicose/D-tagatose/L-ribulose 3-epimerase [Cribrihabitans marinus]|uniref:D-psicose/D-tagatose/L-ribulose 3-epimerase n=1 Tax=Cribrihabitans marinus TaxID=1227549 RepID=A0A1H7DR87_9RHOB|nr:sugar phosphate isomerase/epimerase [Cribrihabitans marinus]GGH39798.1 isomerase [Cribrihabitans marinus]SEK04321.1 D-psicose/D-tagatose/L-ribulose 3-epimerase [Cribrihabitans marinus]
MLAGFNLLLWTTHLTDDLLGQCAAIKAAGYDGVEVPVFEGDPAHYASLARKLDDLGLRRTAVGVVQSPEANPMAAEARHRQAGVDHLNWMVDCCAALGAEVLCGPFHQPLATFSGTGPTGQELAHLAEAHRAMAAHAEGSGVALSVEPLNRFECYALNTLEQSSDLVAAVGAEGYGCLFDTFHANIEEKDVGAAIHAAGSAINHVHFSENDRGTPGAGHVDFAEASAALKAVGYDGWIVIEAFGQALPDLAAATRVWRPLFGHEDEVVAAGIDVIRRNWG